MQERKINKEEAKKNFARVITHDTSAVCDNTANTVGYFFERLRRKPSSTFFL